MSMRTAFQWGLGLSLSFFSMTMVGCYIETSNDCDWDDDDCLAPDAPEIERPHRDEDTQANDGDVDNDDEGTASSGDEGSASGGGADGSSSEDPAACKRDCDCPSGSACVEGTCKTPCAASCDCAEGESCEAGYCAPPPEPAISCEANCDCPGGSACVEGLCT